MIRRAAITILAVAAATTAPACDAVFGLHEAPDTIVSGSFARIRVTNGSDLAPATTTEVFPTTRLALTAVLDSGATAAVDYDPTTGAFSFVRDHGDQRYTLLRMLDGDVRTYDLSTSRADLVETVFGRADAQPVTEATPITFDVGPFGDSDVRVVSTGSWSETALAEGPGAGTFDWRLASPTTATPVTLLDADAGDALYVSRFDHAAATASAPAYTGLVSAARIAATFTDGSAQTVTGALETEDADCVTFDAFHLADAARIEALVGSDAYHGAFSVLALPAPALATSGAGSLAFADESTASDQVVTLHAVDPYVGTARVVTVVTTVSQPISLGSAAPAASATATEYFLPLAHDASCGSNVAPAAPPVGIAHAFTLAGAAVDADATIALASDADAVFAWTLDGPADLVTVSIEEVSADLTANQTILTPRLGIETDATQVTIPHGTLQSGRHYVVFVSSLVGMPGARDGAIGTLVYPIGFSQAATHVITIAPQ